MLISNLFTAVSYFLLHKTITSVHPNFAGLWYFYCIFALANIVFVILLFMWKKWPFFAFCGSSIVALVMNLVIGLHTITVMLGLLGPIILYLSMRSQWNLFE